VEDAYPGWKPNPNSPIVKTTCDVFERLFGKRPEIKAIHAGLECGLLIEKVPGMDVVSIGPQIENAHSPDEKVQISSVQRFYEHLGAVLEELA
jgi:dipeptidase D